MKPVLSLCAIAFITVVPTGAMAQSMSPSPVITAPESRVLVNEVVVKGVESTLQAEVYRVIRTQPGRQVTRRELQADIDAIAATGYFSKVEAVPQDTSLGVQVAFIVEPNPILQSVQLEGNQVVPAKVVADIFKPQYGSTLNLNQLNNGIKKLNQWYQDNGYVVAQVTDQPKISSDGTVTLSVAEGVIEEIQVQFISKQGEDKTADGKPIRGRTRDFIITREFQTKRGEILNRDRIQKDLQRVAGLELFDDVKLFLKPGTDPTKVIVVASVAEKSGNLLVSPGATYSPTSGLAAGGDIQWNNIGGNNQKLNGNVQVGGRQNLAFNLGFTNPWIAGDPYHTSYTVNGFRQQSVPLVFDGGKTEVRLPNDDRPRVTRTGGSLSFTRPLSKNPYDRADWVASTGLQYQRVTVVDRDGKISPKDSLGNDLSFSGKGKDDLLSFNLGVVRDRSNDRSNPTKGSILQLNTEQSVPVGSGNILLNRLQASYSFYIPTHLTRLTRGCRNKTAKGSECPQTFAFNVKGGTVIGDLPPYEAFSLGGINSVRGYDQGDLGSVRSFLQASAEYRFPISSLFSAALFADAATDLGSSSSVLGDPAGARGKPGSGFGYGLGIRVKLPFAPLRFDYGFNDRGEGRFQFGFGEKF